MKDPTSHGPLDTKFEEQAMDSTVIEVRTAGTSSTEDLWSLLYLSHLSKRIKMFSPGFSSLRL